MKQINKKFKIVVLAYAATLMLFAFVPLRQSFAATPDATCQKLLDQINSLDKNGSTTESPAINPVDKLPAYCTVNNLSFRIIQILFAVAGGIAVLFIMIGGFQYIVGMSTGGDEAIGKAKKTITYAVIGLTVIVLSGTLVIMLYNLLTGGSGTGGTGTGIGGGPIINQTNPSGGGTGGGTTTNPPGTPPGTTTNPPGTPPGTTPPRPTGTCPDGSTPVDPSVPCPPDPNNPGM